MDTSASAQTLLSALGHQLGMNDLQFNEDQVCRIVIDGATIIDMEYVKEQESIYLIGTVAANLSMTLEIAELLLQANLFGRGTRGAVFSYDEEKDEVVLFQEQRLASTQSEAFIAVFEGFLEEVEVWSKRLLDLHDEEAVESSSQDPASGFSADYIRV